MKAQDFTPGELSTERHVSHYALWQFFSRDPTYLRPRGDMAKRKGDD
jgi:hypothetical protein